MKKLVLVMSIAALLAMGAFATSYTLTPSLSVSGSYSFGFVLGNQGIDLTNKLSSDLSVSAAWSSNFDTFTQPATWTFDFSLFDWGSTPKISVKSVKYESVVNSLDFETASKRAFSPMFWSNGSAAGLTYVYKPMSALTTQYLDTTNDGASASPSTPLFANPFFKDEVAANYAGSGYAVSAAMYYEASNTNLYGYFAGMSYTGTELTKGLSVKAAYGKDLMWKQSVSTATTWDSTPVSNNPVSQMALDVSYKNPFEISKTSTLTLSGKYVYTSNFTPKYEAFVKNADGSHSPSYHATSNEVTAGVSFATKLHSMTFTPALGGTYDFLKKGATYYVKTDAVVPIGAATLTSSVKYSAVSSPTTTGTVTAKVGADISVGNFTISPNIAWSDLMGSTASPTWNVDAQYVKNVTFTKNATVEVTKVATDAKTGKAATTTTKEATVFTKKVQLYSLEGYASSKNSGPAYGGYYLKATYNVGASYEGNMWTLTGFFGTLGKDTSGNYTQVVKPYWYVEASASVSF